ncbi:MAG: hypothetical protein H6993_00500 [Pseudomonadales bacterium]|nr:hypothetical protein [Pseudomonadales bacterium]MCP5182403.1 hypothetical protein [Pseudomonadales bacterium]
MRELTCDEISEVSGGGDAMDSAGAATVATFGLLGMAIKLGGIGIVGAAALPVAAGFAAGAAVGTAIVAVYWSTRTKRR